MEKRSTHWADVVMWIEKIIDSAKTKEQKKVCEKLIENYETLYKSQKNMTHEAKLKLWKLK